MSKAARRLANVLFAFVFLTLAVPGGPAFSQGLATNVGPLKVELKDDGKWKAESRSGWLLLSNRTDPGSINMYYNQRPALGAGTRSVSTNLIVRGSGNGPSFAGLLFDYTDGRNFMAALVRNDGAVAWLTQDQGNTRVEVASGARANMDGTDVLELRERGNRVEIILNGNRAMTAQSPDGFAQGVGIVAIGTGRFGFDAFAVTEANAAPERRETPERRDTPEAGTGFDMTTMGPEELRRTQILMGTTLGVLFHELGHALIGETKLPATGPEEDVADGFSAFVLSSIVTEAENARQADIVAGIARYKALLWYYVADAKKRGNVLHNWQGEHAPDMRRFRNVFCILYGASPTHFESIAIRVKLTLPTRSRCQQEYEKRYAAWDTLLATVSRNLGPDVPGKLPADTPGGRLIVTVEPPQSRIGREVVRMIEGENQMLTAIASYLEKAIVWPNDVRITFKHCPGQPPNAWYDPAAHSVTMCYEVIEHFTKFIFEGEARDGPLEVVRGPDVDPAAFLPGRWSTRIRRGDGVVVGLDYVFDRQGRYRLDLSVGSESSWVEGTWTAEKTPSGLVTLRMTPESWEPRQSCDQNGNCQPIRQTPETVSLQVKSNDAFHTSGLDFQRAR